MQKSLLIFLLSASLLVACQRDVDHSANHEEATQHAMDLMHKGQNDEAIDVLKTEQSRRPQERTLILLASAYAHRAGVNVDNYWGFLIGYDNLIKNAKLFAESKDDVDIQEIMAGLPSEIRDAVKGLNINLKDVYMVRKRLDQIPVVNETQQKDVLQAIQTLSDAKTPGGRLYRGILEVIMLRTAAETSVGLFSDLIKNPKLDCKENLDQTLEWIQYTTELFQDLLVDVSLAYPSQKEEVAKLQSQSKDLLKNLSSSSRQVQGLLCKK